jgi:hypothetical protein
MVERLVGTVVRGEQADDVTLLVLRRLPPRDTISPTQTLTN